MKKALLLLSLWLTVPLLAHANELEERAAIRTNVQALFQAERFEELSALAKRYLQGEDKTPSGVWKLAVLDKALESLEAGNPDDLPAVHEKLQHWVKNQPDSASAYLAYAQYLAQVAWTHRSDEADDNSQDDDDNARPVFYTYLDKERDYLLAHRKVAAKDPRWYEAMIRIGVYEQWNGDDFAALLTEATHQFPYYYPLYDAALAYTQPKWNGSIEEMDAFIEQAVATTAKKYKSSLYARLYWSLSQTDYGSRLFDETAANWPKMSQAMEELVAQYPDQWNINNFAHFACMAGDREKTRELINRIRPAPMLQGWDNDQSSFDQCKQWSRQLQINPETDRVT